MPKCGYQNHTSHLSQDMTWEWQWMLNQKLYWKLKSKETPRKSEQCLNKFGAFVEASGSSYPIENMEKKSINQLLCNFLIQLKREDGSNYEINSMRTMFSMLGNFVKTIGKGNVEAVHEYVGFRDVTTAGQSTSTQSRNEHGAGTLGAGWLSCRLFQNYAQMNTKKSLIIWVHLRFVPIDIATWPTKVAKQRVDDPRTILCRYMKSGHGPKGLSGLIAYTRVFRTLVPILKTYSTIGNIYYHVPEYVFNPRTCRGSNGPPWFSQITRRETYSTPRWSIWHILWKFQVDVMSGHQVMTSYVRSCSDEIGRFAICRTRVRVLASQRMSMHSMRVYWCLWMSRYHIQLTQGQDHARSRFIGASSMSI